MSRTLSTREQRIRRHKRVRAKINGTFARPRLCIFRSNRYIWVQVIDDTTGKTLAHAGDRELGKSAKTGKKAPTMEEKRTALAGKVGELIAKRVLEQKISKLIFDRGGLKYHGIVKALVEGARKGGIEI